MSDEAEALKKVMVEGGCTPEVAQAAVGALTPEQVAHAAMRLDGIARMQGGVSE